MESILCYQSQYIDKVYDLIKDIKDLYTLCSKYLNDKYVYFLPKKDAEQNVDFRQCIPYLVLQCGSTYMMYTRTSKGDEERLHQKKSLGVGGHINLEDVIIQPYPSMDIDVFQTVLACIERELDEEVEITRVSDDLQKNVEILGIIKESETDVDKAHVGIACLIPIQKDEIEYVEDTLDDIQFCTLEELGQDYENFEIWSKIVYMWLKERGERV